MAGAVAAWVVSGTSEQQAPGVNSAPSARILLPEPSYAKSRVVRVCFGCRLVMEKVWCYLPHSEKCSMRRCLHARRSFLSSGENRPSSSNHSLTARAILLTRGCYM
eukprot:scaffold7732_cov457-Prasinococcus_capsulatus_cf.AAC.1